MEKRTELFPEERVSRLTRGNRIWTALTAAAALLTLAGCIVLCLLADTATEDRSELLTLAVSGVGGCVVIFLWTHAVRGSRAELRHIATLRCGEQKVLQGKVTLLPGRFRIPESVTVQQLRVETPSGGSERAAVIARCAKLLKNRTQPLRLYTSHGYVTAFEDAYEES